MNKVVFITPMYNAGPHLPELFNSLFEQSNQNWEQIVIDDMSTDDSYNIAMSYHKKDNRITVIKNNEKKWALRNVVEQSRKFEKDEVIIAILDADDCLCNEQTVGMLIEKYAEDDENDCVWTGHTWDINNLNISRKFPDGRKINPYQYPWCSSHLKTYRSSLLFDIKDENFKDLDNNWFQRGYDQALYLPLLYKSRKINYMDEICYFYRINSSSVTSRDWKEQNQLNTVKLVRARGFVE